MVVENFELGRGKWKGYVRKCGLLLPAKTAEPIEMPFGLWAQIGARNHLLEGSRSPWKGVILRGERGRPL